MECKDLERSLETVLPEYAAYVAVLITLHDLAIFAKTSCITIDELDARVLMPRESLHRVLKTLVQCHIVREQNKCLSLTDKGTLLIEKIRWGKTRT
ncbi:MAG TPA: hypothetical protein EYP48_01320 [Ignisphaera sp.]|nr:hypothetical protein [Ignisphaera sp.]